MKMQYTNEIEIEEHVGWCPLCKWHA